MFLQLFAPLVLVILYNHSIQNSFSTGPVASILTHFVDVFSTSFQVSFLTMFSWLLEAIWGSIWHQFSKKNASENGFEKRGPTHQNDTLWTCPEAPREAASRARFSNKKQQFEHKFQTMLLELMFCVRKCCFNLFPLHFFPKMFEKLKRVDVKNTLLIIWHAQSAKGLAN